MAAEEGTVVTCHSKEEVDTHIAQGKETGKLVIIDFTASLCGPCRLMAPIFAELAKKFSCGIFLKVDVDELQEVSIEYDVKALPAFLFIKEGKAIDKTVGANKDELEKKLASYASSSST